VENNIEIISIESIFPGSTTLTIKINGRTFRRISIRATPVFWKELTPDGDLWFYLTHRDFYEIESIAKAYCLKNNIKDLWILENTSS